MPSRNSIKSYIEGGYYHLYNRGVEKRQIFMDDQDYRVFLSYLKLYLLSPDPEDFNQKIHKDLSTTIDLVAYCLMPNHFHLLVRQHTAKGIEEFMRCINIKYAMYFNKRHDRTGGLFQDAYKAVLIQNDEYLMHLSRYIHCNPALMMPNIIQYPYSSYHYYLTESPPWLKPHSVKELFTNEEAYRQFINLTDIDPLAVLHNLAIDSE